MATTAELLLRLKADATHFNKNLSRGQTALNKFKGTVVKVAGVLGVAFSARALVGFVKESINAADELAKLSQKVGISVEQLSSLKHAGELADVSLVQLSTGLGQLSKNAFDAAMGTGDAKVAFENMGISVTNTQGALKSSDALLLEVTEKLAGMADGTEKTALAMKIFGRSGRELIPLLNEGKDGLLAMRNEADRFGVTMGTRLAQQAEQFNDNLTRMKALMQGLVNGIMEGALPALNMLTDAFLRGNNGARDFGQSVGQWVIEMLADAGDAFVTFGTYADTLQNMFSYGFIRTDEEQQQFEARAKEIQDLYERVTAANEKMRNALVVSNMGDVPPAKKPTADPQASALTAGKATVDQAEKYLNNLRQQLALLTDSSNVAKVRWDIEHEGMAKATEAQKQSALNLAGELDSRKAANEALEEQIRLNQEALDAEAEAARLRDTNWEGINDLLQSKRDELQLAQAVTDAKRERIQLAIQLRELNAQNVGWVATELEGIQQQIDAANKQRANEVTWMERLQEAGKEAARSIQGALSDALMIPLGEGKEAWMQWLSDLAKSLQKIAADILSMFIMDVVTGAIKSSFGGGGGVNPANVGGRAVSVNDFLGAAQTPAFAVGAANNQQAMTKGGAETPVVVKNINVFDGQFIGDYLQSPRGEKVVLNVIQKNRMSLGMT